MKLGQVVAGGDYKKYKFLRNVLLFGQTKVK